MNEFTPLKKELIELKSDLVEFDKKLRQFEFKISRVSESVKNNMRFIGETKRQLDLIKKEAADGR